MNRYAFLALSALALFLTACSKSNQAKAAAPSAPRILTVAAAQPIR